MAGEDWRETKSAAQCLEHICLSERYSDVTFGFPHSPVKVRAHKFILSIRSAVFEAMFYGPMSGTGQEITLTDCDPETFTIFLKYLYTDEVGLNGVIVSSCLYLARKYCVDRLVEECSRFLHTSISPDNACTIYEQSVLYDMKDLQQECMNYMIDHDRGVLSSDDLLNLSRDTFKEFLASDELSTEESVIFDTCLRWARNKLVMSEEEITIENVRKCLGDVFYSIRFPLVPMETFARNISSVGLLSTEEEVQLYRHIATVKSDDKGSAKMVGRFKAVPRMGRSIEVEIEKRQQVAQRFHRVTTTKVILELDTPIALTVRSLKGSLLNQVYSVQLKCFNKGPTGGLLFVGYKYGSLKFEHNLSRQNWTVKDDDLEFTEKMDLPIGIAQISFGLRPNYVVSEIGRYDQDIKVKQANVKLSYSTYITGSIDAIVFSK